MKVLLSLFYERYNRIRCLGIKLHIITRTTSFHIGMAVAVDNTLFFADGSNIRMVDSRGIIHTLIGDHHHKRQWRPIPCSGTLKVEEVRYIQHIYI